MLRLFRRWRFETPEMEAEFQAQMCTIVAQAFNGWCSFLILVFALLVARCYTVPHFPPTTAIPCLLVLALLIGLAVAVNCCPCGKQCLPAVLPLVCTAIVGLIAWSVHLMVCLFMDRTLDVSLARTVALIANEPAALAELDMFARDLMSKRLWYLGLLIMYVGVDALRLTGTTHHAFYAHLSPIVAIATATYCSGEISHNATEVLCTAAVFTVYAVASSLHMLMTFRDRFRFDYRLRRRMALEAEGMEVAKNVEVAQRLASQKADSMLNHILKNIMAEAHGCIDLYFGQRGEGDAADGHLHRAQESLERGMRWCKKRQVMVQVNSGDYTPVLAPTSLPKLIEGMVYGRDIAVDIPDVTVQLDSLLCEVVLDNAISNAFRHGDTTMGPISLLVTTDAGKERPLRVTFTLTNYIPDGHPPVTPELVAQLAAGHNVVGLANVSALSDHLGLRHMFMAAAAHGMTASLEQIGNLVMFTATLEADVADEEPPEGPADPPLPLRPAAFPSGLRILCLDDSEIARRVLLHGLAARAPQTVSQAYGATVDEVAAFQVAALAGADIVVLDQHLDYHHVTVYGTDIAQRLRRAGYGGFICVRSANATDEDEAVYRRCGADCMIGKDVPLRDMVEALELAYEQHLRARRKAKQAGGEHSLEDSGVYLGSISLCSLPDNHRVP